MFCRKKNRVGCAIILQQMGQQQADRRSGQGSDQGRKNAWAPSLVDAVTGLQDVRVEYTDDPERVWRLETLLGEVKKEANKQ